MNWWVSDYKMLHKFHNKNVMAMILVESKVINHVTSLLPANLQHICLQRLGLYAKTHISSQAFHWQKFCTKNQLSWHASEYEFSNQISVEWSNLFNTFSHSSPSLFTQLQENYFWSGSKLNCTHVLDHWHVKLLKAWGLLFCRIHLANLQIPWQKKILLRNAIIFA